MKIFLLLLDSSVQWRSKMNLSESTDCNASFPLENIDVSQLVMPDIYRDHNQSFQNISEDTPTAASRLHSGWLSTESPIAAKWTSNADWIKSQTPFTGGRKVTTDWIQKKDDVRSAANKILEGQVNKTSNSLLASAGNLFSSKSQTHAGDSSQTSMVVASSQTPCSQTSSSLVSGIATHPSSSAASWLPLQPSSLMYSADGGSQTNSFTNVDDMIYGLQGYTSDTYSYCRDYYSPKLDCFGFSQTFPALRYSDCFPVPSRGSFPVGGAGAYCAGSVAPFHGGGSLAFPTGGFYPTDNAASRTAIVAPLTVKRGDATGCNQDDGIAMDCCENESNGLPSNGYHGKCEVSASARYTGSHQDHPLLYSSSCSSGSGQGTIQSVGGTLLRQGQSSGTHTLPLNTQKK